MWERGVYDLRGDKARRVGGKGALDECGEHSGCSGVIPGGLEVQSLGKGPSSILTGGAAEKSMLSGLDILLAPKSRIGRCIGLNFLSSQKWSLMKRGLHAAVERLFRSLNGSEGK